MKLLDLFCGAGGSAMGYYRAGFTEIVGVDIKPQPRYPFTFVQGDALACADIVAANKVRIWMRQFDAIHASPPCQAFSRAQRIQRNEHPDHITPLRRLLLNSGLPFVIENVEGAPLEQPILLCGAMFNLQTYRHRLFECSFSCSAPEHPEHLTLHTKMGRPVADGTFMHVVGNFSGVAKARQVMQIGWMTRDELREAIPPTYTEFIGRQLIQAIQVERCA